MQMTVEISMYPFNEDYKTLIKGFIVELNKREHLEIDTSATATMIHGEFEHVMDTLKEMLAWSYDTYGKAVYVTKFIPGHDLTE